MSERFSIDKIGPAMRERAGAFIPEATALVDAFRDYNIFEAAWVLNREAAGFDLPAIAREAHLGQAHVRRILVRAGRIDRRNPRKEP